jgi:outer membrane receptor protein involved in Fe transport
MSAEIEFDQFKRASEEPANPGTPTEVETLTLPLDARYFHPSGFFAELGGTFVRQEVELSPASILARDSDNFFLLDAAIGYRLPKRRGILSLEARNLLDEEFFFQDQNIQTTDPVNPRFIPDRIVFGRVTLSF